MRLAARLWFVALLLTSGTAGQIPAQTDEVVEVRVTGVDVVVTDSRGIPIEGLTKNDFEILEDGKPHEISNFQEVKLGKGGSPGQSFEGSGTSDRSADGRSVPHGRRFIVYLDNVTLSPGARNELLLAGANFMRRNLQKNDQVLIATWNRSMRIRLSWTSDLKKVQQTFDLLMKEDATASAAAAERRMVESQIRQMALDNKLQESSGSFSGPANSYGDLVASARRYAASVQNDVEQSMGALSKLLATLSGVDGRRILLMASQSLPTRPGSDMFQLLDDLQNAPGAGPGGALPKTMGQQSKSGSLAGEISSYDTSKAIQTVARAANAAGVTIYALNPIADGASSSAGVERTAPGSASMDFTMTNAGMEGFQILANSTGGQAMIGARAPVAFAALEQDLRSYYSIGYRSRAGDSAERSIEVRSKNSAHRVRTRRNVFYKSLQMEMADHVVANHYQEQFPNNLQVSLAVGGAVQEEGGKKILPLRVLVPVARLSIIPEGNEFVGGFSVYVSSADARGNVSAVSLQKHDIRWPREAYQQLKGKSFTFATDVVVIEVGRKTVSVGVVDRMSQEMGFAKLTLP